MDAEQRAIDRAKLLAKNNLDPKKIPQHIAVIMDGNGRWAKKRLLPRNLGHKAGSEALRATIKACVALGIPYLSAYVFSTENWSRPQKEVDFLMTLLQELIIKEVPALNKAGVKVKYLGAIEELPAILQENIKEAELATSTNQLLTLNLMLNYGSRKEITTACLNIANDYQKGVLTNITEETISQYLYTKNNPEIDILIRTGGDIRISNYMLWQIAYSELFFLPILWPDFNQKVLIEVIQQFQTRDRRFGGLTKA